MLLSVAYGEEISQAVFRSLRRVAKHWHGGDTSLAAIQLAQTGLPDIGEDAAYRLSLAAELIDAGVAPDWLARELGFGPAAGLLKYNPDEPRVPAGSGRASGDWTFADAATVMSGVASAHVATHTEKEINRVPDLPKDAVAVARPDGAPIEGQKSPTGKLMAPPKADFREVYGAGASANPMMWGQCMDHSAISAHSTSSATEEATVSIAVTSMPPTMLLVSIWPRVMINGRRSTYGFFGEYG